MIVMSYIVLITCNPQSMKLVQAILFLASFHFNAK